ncbi:hypothetical protein GF386_02695 [Candidatus Pacearchaeota archaeon]|nr:hypothetical protein [Candidatus Pacearchaeota archaeon]MBD3283057.1 hypothetical protein [Candidatus Pacearchaeota archaeon]
MDLSIRIPSIDELLENADIELIVPEQGGLTKEVHSVRYRGREFILRICSNGNADAISFYSDFLSPRKILPRLLRRRGEYLLFEYLDGRDCNYDNRNVAYEVGRISGEVTKIPCSVEKDFDEIFGKALDYLLSNGLIDDEKASRIIEKYWKLRPAEPETRIELSDVIPGNFRLSSGRLYLVDVDSIGPRMKGRCFSKAFLKWFKDRYSRERFKQGYDSVADPGFLTSDYLQYLYLRFAIGKARAWHKRNGKQQKAIDWIDLLLEDNLS